MNRKLSVLRFNSLLVRYGSEKLRRRRKWLLVLYIIDFTSSHRKRQKATTSSQPLCDVASVRCVTESFLCIWVLHPPRGLLERFVQLLSAEFLFNYEEVNGYSTSGCGRRFLLVFIFGYSMIEKLLKG